MLSAFGLYFPANHGDFSILVLKPLKKTFFACCALIATLIISMASPEGLPKYFAGSFRHNSLYTIYAHATVDVKSFPDPLPSCRMTSFFVYFF
jgi:hypothetical protein